MSLFGLQHPPVQQGSGYLLLTGLTEFPDVLVRSPQSRPGTEWELPGDSGHSDSTALAPKDPVNTKWQGLNITAEGRGSRAES